MRKRLIGLLAAIALLVALVPYTQAAVFSVASGSCSGYIVSNSACFEEHGNGTGGDVLLLIQSPTAVPNLQNIATPSGRQCLGLFANTHYSDCLSYVAYSLNSGYELCAWRNSSYGGTKYIDINGPAQGSLNITGDANDSISSVVIEAISGGHC